MKKVLIIVLVIIVILTIFVIIKKRRNSGNENFPPGSPKRKSRLAQALLNSESANKNPVQNLQGKAPVRNNRMQEIAKKLNEERETVINRTNEK